MVGRLCPFECRSLLCRFELNRYVLLFLLWISAVEGCLLVQDGLHEVETKDEIKSPDPTPSRKRKAENEIADSQDEDSEGEYEWMEEALLDPN